MRKPWNSEPVDFSSTRSDSPDTTCVVPASAVTATVRTSVPRRTNVWSWGAPSTDARSHACSSTVTRADVTGATSSTKCRASAVAKASGEAMPTSLA